MFALLSLLCFVFFFSSFDSVFAVVTDCNFYFMALLVLYVNVCTVCMKICNSFTRGAPRSSQELVYRNAQAFQYQNWNLELLVFEERGKPAYPGKNLSEPSREPTTTQGSHI